MNNLNVVQQFAMLVLPVLFGITVHEVAHGWMAYRLGDSTALMLGRITLNPLKHIDLIGTLLVPITLWLIGTSFIFGWAKPVPITFENLRRPKRDMAIVAAAGPLSNLIMALLWGGLIKIGYLLATENATSWVGVPLVFMGLAGLNFNSLMTIMNLIPIPPLDGGRILVGLLPAPFAGWVARIESYGMIILLILLSTGILEQVMIPMVHGMQNVIVSILHLKS